VTLSKLVRTINERFLNGGTPLILMGAQWLYLWLFIWYKTFLEDQRWGHNFVMSLAFLAVGLAYFNRRLLSDILAVIAAALVIPASLALLPHNITSIFSSALILLIVVDIIVERRNPLFFKKAASSAIGWFKKYLLCFSYILLVSLPPCYFLVELAAGTCDSDIDSILFDVALLPFVILLLLEKIPLGVNKVLVKRIGFFWGMITMVVILSLMIDQPETLPNLIVTSLVTLAGLTTLLITSKSKV
jgi:hypothetical protein